MWGSLAVFIVAVIMVAMTGAIFKPGPWYETLEKPSWTPPDWAFPVVWSILYLFIAIAGWLVWQSSGWSLALALWILQLLLNGAWSWLFFGLKRMDLAFVDVSLLWLCIAGFIVIAWPISTTAALLFLPYLVWVSIAAALNLTVWRMNPIAVSSP
ncbi:MAG: TspO/MBR family protein [Pseudomonadota bacterium]